MVKRFLSILFILCISLQVFAYNFTSNSSGTTIYYNIVSPSARTVEVTWGATVSGTYSGDIVIPSSVTYNGSTYTVVGIGPNAFLNCTSLVNVTFPNTITSIGSDAFSNCWMYRHIVLPNSLTSIGNRAFNQIGMDTITIPSSVTSIGTGVFNFCSFLRNITVESGNPVYDSRDSCNAIIETATNTLISGCRNTVIPNTVTSIGDVAFAGTAISAINIPSSVTSIVDNPFAGCNWLSDITVDSDNPAYDCRDNCFAIIETATNKLVTGISRTKIPNTITSIGDFAFLAIQYFTDLIIPSQVTSIGHAAFLGCDLQSITSFAATPPQLSDGILGVFSDAHYSIPLYVPCGSSSQYASAWPNFTNVSERLPYIYEFRTTTISYLENRGEISVLGQPTCVNPYATIMAVANPGYRFQGWIGGDTSNPRTVHITSDTLIIASFVEVVDDIETAESSVQIFTKENSIYVNGSEGESLIVFDVYGRIIYQGTAEDNKPYKLPQTGVYMVKVGESPVQKVVIK